MQMPHLGPSGSGSASCGCGGLRSCSNRRCLAGDSCCAAVGRARLAPRIGTLCTVLLTICTSAAGPVPVVRSITFCARRRGGVGACLRGCRAPPLPPPCGRPAPSLSLSLSTRSTTSTVARPSAAGGAAGVVARAAASGTAAAPGPSSPSSMRVRVRGPVAVAPDETQVPRRYVKAAVCRGVGRECWRLEEGRRGLGRSGWHLAVLAAGEAPGGGHPIVNALVEPSSSRPALAEARSD